FTPFLLISLVSASARANECEVDRHVTTLYIPGNLNPLAPAPRCVTPQAAGNQYCVPENRRLDTIQHRMSLNPMF
ncbi:MAG: hypothetical protein WB764_07890, partial [Xanthobacteraceae bacterium]